MENKITISTDKRLLDINFIHRFLTNTYWANGRTKIEVEKTITHSICFGVFLNEEQIGFARVVSDRTVFAYLMDVFIIENHRGKEYSKALMKAILNDESLQDVQQWYLRTSDAQGLYSQFGFTTLDHPERMMVRRLKKYR